MDREKVISTFEKIISVCKEDGCDFVDLTFEDAEQILALLKEQNGLMLALDQSNAVNGYLNAEVERLNVLLKEQSNCENCAMAIEDRQIVRCKDCMYKEESVSPYWDAWCHRLHCGCDSDWFCADGVKKDG